jgi:chitin disaccharide deacetylase
MAGSRLLVVNADDFGRSRGVNAGVIAAHERGIVTSASLMVRWADADEAAAFAREHPALSVGLHLDLGEWAYVDGAWHPCYEVVALDDAASVGEEIDRQLRSFRRLVGRDPTHIDSHQHVHRRQPVRSMLAARAIELSVPLRHFSSAVRYCGEFYGQEEDGSPIPAALTPARLVDLISRVGTGVTELCCHPGLDDRVTGVYSAERAVELETLCAPRVREALSNNGVELTSFQELP